MWLYRKKWHVAVKSIISGVFALAIIGSTSDDSPTPASPSTRTTQVTTVLPTPAQKQQAAKAVVQAKPQGEGNERDQTEEPRQQDAEQRKQAEYDKTHYKIDGLTLDGKSVHWAKDESGFASYITGKITNDTGGDLDYAEITYKELDGEGNQVGKAVDNTTHLPAGATWKFKCPVTEASTKRIQLDRLKNVILIRKTPSQRPNTVPHRRAQATPAFFPEGGRALRRQAAKA